MRLWVVILGLFFLVGGIVCFFSVTYWWKDLLGWIAWFVPVAFCYPLICFALVFGAIVLVIGLYVKSSD